jgi:hypothetical protein
MWDEKISKIFMTKVCEKECMRIVNRHIKNWVLGVDCTNGRPW